MKKFVIDSDSMDIFCEGKFCDCCGKRSSVTPTGSFDDKTGRPLAVYQCIDFTCRVGQNNLETKKRDQCQHDIGTNILDSIFNIRRQCRKCGKSNTSDSLLDNIF